MEREKRLADRIIEIQHEYIRKMDIINQSVEGVHASQKQINELYQLFTEVLEIALMMIYGLLRLDPKVNISEHVLNGVAKLLTRTQLRFEKQTKGKQK